MSSEPARGNPAKVPCPVCGMPIPRRATTCQYCAEPLPKRPDSAPAPPAPEAAALSTERDAILVERARSQKRSIQLLGLGILLFFLVGAVANYVGPLDDDEFNPLVFIALLPVVCWFPSFSYFVKYKGQPNILSILFCAGCAGLLAIIVLPDINKRRIEEIDAILGDAA